MSKPKSGPQDLPPKGGYAPFQIDRVKLQRIITGRWGIGILLATNIFGFPLYYKNWVECRKDDIEFTSTQVATTPILCAERDRTTLRHLKRLRAFETDVMKNFPYWEVGTFFGVPIYETLPEDQYVEPTAGEFYLGSNPRNVPFLAYANYGF